MATISASFSTKDIRNTFSNFGKILTNATADLLSDGNFISRTIGMNNSYEDIMLIVQSLGRQPVSLLGKDYLFIFDHVRRNYQQGTTISSVMYGIVPDENGDNNYYCPKFTFYKEKPTVKFANPYGDHLNLLERWFPDISFNNTKSDSTSFFYAESNDGHANNKVINSAVSNLGVATGQISSSFQNLGACDLIRKTNTNFRNGKFNTLIARFHTNTPDSRDLNNPIQTAVSKGYGMSHGRNLLKLTPDEPNGYNNPYCRVWTYHHQYHRIFDAIRPFENEDTAEALEKDERVNSGDSVGFRTISSKDYDFDGGSIRLDKHGALNYFNGLVNIAPTAKLVDYFEGKTDDKNKKAISIKKCMFSIENLAWREQKNNVLGEYSEEGLSPEQRGPLGGRIMWFPPYDINFNEDVSVKWNSNEFIGRGENIYTYTNTERRGNLSFTIVIDHPSIIDYWTGHERNGMKNKGNELLPGNTDGVDGKDNQENTLLRFFAGCDILTAKPQTYKKKNVEAIKPQEGPRDSKPNVNPGGPTETVNTPGEHTLFCVLYYPNNYSGVDDKPYGSNPKVNAIHYLMNGIGAQKYVGDNCKDEDIPTVIDVAPGMDGTGHGGYEINGNISIATEPLVKNKAKRQSTYCDKTSSDERAQYLTGKDGGEGYKVTYGGSGDNPGSESNPYILAKIVDYGHVKKYSQVLNDTWHYGRWYYRVDDAYKDDKLTAQTSYIDTVCENLNCCNGDGYKKILNNKSIRQTFGIPDDLEKSNFHLVSFADLFYVLEEGCHNVINGSNIDSKNCDIIERVFKLKDGVKIKSIEFNGHASSAGSGESNTTLSNNRAETFKAWMTERKFPNPENGQMKRGDPKNQDGSKNNVNNGIANSPEAKMWRSASVKIIYTMSETEDASKQETKAGTEAKPLDQTNEVRDTNSLKTKYEEWVKNYYDKGSNAWILSIKLANPNITDNELLKLFAEQILPGLEEETKVEEVKEEEKLPTVERYDNEGEFFELLDRADPFLHHLITDKIKYFDPAYHAISPEGFNARLTFLHQCTRQGATISNSDTNAKSAYNLAFGRPPICVLRLGDFYNTKIVINSMTLTFDEPQWDLNPEGIGVMPMFAKVSINFTFLGGSDLAGPIARLQNAVSFNYYANTSVYDNRAERIEYSDEQDGKEVKYYPYNYPNKNGRPTSD